MNDTTKPTPKRQLAVTLHEQGLGVVAISALLGSDPAYVANVLIDAGYAPGYSDLYTTTGPENGYAAQLAGVLRFKDLEAARESVRTLDTYFHAFAANNDRRGMHQCQVLALVGKNRAEGIGKLAEARLFTDWLSGTLHERYPQTDDQSQIEESQAVLDLAA
jgi:hypothetical protein